MKLKDFKLVPLTVRPNTVVPVQAVAVFFYVTGTGLKYKFFGADNVRTMEFAPFFSGREFVMPEHIATERDACDENVALKAYNHALMVVNQDADEQRRIEAVVLRMKEEGKI